MKRFLTAVGVFVAFVFLVWTVAVPSDYIEGKIKGLFAGAPFTLGFEGFEKGLCCAIKARKLYVHARGGLAGKTLLLALEDIKAGPDLSGFLSLRPAVYFNAAFSGGRVTGSYDISARTGVFKGKGIGIEGMDLLKRAGLNGSGMLSLNVDLKDDKASARFSVEGARFKAMVHRGVYIPLNMFKSVKGAVEVSGGLVTMRSISLEGNGIYARITGKVRGGQAEMNIELNADASSDTGRLLSAGLERYKKAPGVYVIPFSGPVLPDAG
ncbi:MAG: type II secretion system protein GspN [Deltaproteobacteria bacterium]|nr:type II secretion system protein GspN [Deltaproteobacteria bacterium]